MLTTPLSPGEAEATVRRVALEEGVDPAILLSIWQQESTGGTNLGKRGQTLQSGPHAGHYARGPFQIMSFHGEIPGDFEGQARWAARHLKERGVRGYYGEGKAPAGFPTTDEYERQVMARAGKPLQVAQAGRADIVPGLLSPGAQQPPPMTTLEAPQMDEMQQPAGFLDNLMGNPLLYTGAATMAAGGGPAGELGRGVLTGLGGYQAMQSNNSLQEYRRAQIAEQRRKEAAQRQAQMEMERVIATLPPEVQAIARANPEIVSKLAERAMGLNQPWYVTPEGIDPRALEYQQAGAPSTTINMPPNIKEGYEYTQTPEGRITAAPVPGGPADPKTPRSPTEGQRKAAGWFGRMSAVEPELETLEGALGKSGPSAWDYYTAQQPLTNALASDPYKKYLQKSRDWISGILRYESGAAVPEVEFWRYYQTFFAVPGDSASVIEEKRKARRRAAEGLREGAGAAVGDSTVPPLPPGNWEPMR
jgi:hypothetical protein